MWVRNVNTFTGLLNLHRHVTQVNYPPLSWGHASKLMKFFMKCRKSFRVNQFIKNTLFKAW